MNKLTPQLNDQQIRQNIDTLLKAGQPKEKVQEYVNNYKKGSDGNYILKEQSVPAPTATDPNRPIPGTDTAVIPAKPADGSARLSDIPKVVPNALGDIWNLVKEGTYGTAKKLLYDIPKEAFGLATDKNQVVKATKEARDAYLKKTGIDVWADPMGSQSKLGNLAEGAVEATGKTLWGLVPESAKQLANTDALEEIPSQFKELVKENGGSYSKALLAMIKATPDAIPDAVMNYANQIDRARQSVVNHPVNELLGWMGLTSLAAGKVSPKNMAKDSEVLNTPVKDIPSNITENIPGKDIPGKIFRRVQDTRLASEELKKQPEIIQKAVKADIPEPQAKLIYDANTVEKGLMNEMLGKHKKGTEELTMKPEERPDAVIGREVMKTVKFLEDQKKSAIHEESSHVKNISNSKVDFTNSAKAFEDQLELLGVKVGEKGRLDFSKSHLDGPSSAKDRGLLQFAYDKIKPDEMGSYIKSGDELHTIRQSLFEEGQNKNFTEPFKDRVLSIIHNNEGTSLRSNLLHDISEQAGGSGKGYEATATKNAKIQDALQTFYKLIGKDAGGKDTNIQNLTVGEVANRLEGNASAKIENAFQKIEKVAEAYGLKSDVSIRKLVAFKTILKNILGETQHNSLAGGVEQGNRAVLATDAIDVAGNMASGAVSGTIKSVGNFIKSNTKAEQTRALQELLTGIKSFKLPKKTKNSPSKLKEEEPF